MKFLPYEDVPLYLAVNGKDGEYIFAENATLSVNQPLSISRQIDDNILQICEYGVGEDMDYTATNFTADSDFFVTLGPTDGPPRPLATSIRKIEKDSKIMFPNGKHLYFSEDIYPDGHNYVIPLHAKSGNWNLTEGEAQSGYFEPLYKYVSSGPVEGQLSVNFYPNTGNLSNFFNITGLSDPNAYPPVDEERVTGFLGDFTFDNIYLTSFSFSLSPNSISQATASFNVYGALNHVDGLTDNYFSSNLYDQQSVPHGQNSEIIGTTDLDMDHPISFNYSMNVDRAVRYEAPNINSDSTVGLVPQRVSKKSSNISLSVEGEYINPDILSDGFNGKEANIKIILKDLNYQGFEDNSNNILNTFTCSGVITSQSLSVGSNGYLNGSINISQSIQ